MVNKQKTIEVLAQKLKVLKNISGVKLEPVILEAIF